MNKEINVTGSIQNKDEKAYIVLGWYENGKRKQRWITTNLPAQGDIRKKKQMLHDAIAAQKAELMHRSAVADRSTLFADWMLIWLESKKATLAQDTYENYATVVRGKIVPYFQQKGSLLWKISQDDIAAYYKHIQEKDGVSANTLHHHHNYIQSALKYAVTKGFLTTNPAKYIDLPKKQKFRADFYSADQVKELITAAKGTPLEAPILLACWYGFRRSEVIGLTWSAVDFENDTITVMTKAYSRHNENGQLEIVITDQLKTEKSHRTLPLYPAAKEYLLRLKEHQEENKRRFGNAYVDTYADCICVWENGDLIKPIYVTHNFKKLLIENHLPVIRFHDLRHTCASLFINNGESAKHVQEWLGHSSISVTLDLYSHLTMESKREMGDVLDTLLKP